MACRRLGRPGKAEKRGFSIEGAGKKLMSVTAAAAVKVAADFDSGMSKVAAVSGAAGEDLDKLREKAREMGRRRSSRFGGGFCHGVYGHGRVENRGHAGRALRGL